MDRYTGRSAYGIRLPLKVNFEQLQEEIISCIIKASECPKTSFYIPKNGGIIGITESLVARGQNNYTTKEALAKDLESKLIPGEDLVLLFPLLSRNRFLPILEAIAKIKRKITIVLQAPRDEVGNPLIQDLFYWDESKALSYGEFIEKYGESIHPYTKINYMQVYKDVRENIDIVVTDNPNHAASYGRNILICTIHNRHRYKKYLSEKLAGYNIMTLCQICSTPEFSAGYNPEYGVLGANMSDENRIKLFPRDGFKFVKEVQKNFLEKTGKNVEVLIFGDGAYKDPVQQIWELADPVTCPGYTDGLVGTPNEVKLKYVLDNYKGEKVDEHVAGVMKEGVHNDSLGTTPRHRIDLIASLCDLITGSGDTGTPVVYINGYFDTFFNGLPE